MIQIQLEFTGESRRHLAHLERETPRTFRAAHAAAAGHARNRLCKVMKMGGGHGGVPPFAPRHQMTHLLHPGRQAGGLLADKGVIVKFRRGDGQVIGWVDRVAQWASCYQSAARYELKAWEKQSLHRKHRALNGYHIPSWYDRPARPVIKPFTDQLSKDFPGMVLEAFDKEVARRLSKGKAIT